MLATFWIVGTIRTLILQDLLAALAVPSFPFLAALLEERLGVVIPAVKLSILFPIERILIQFIHEETNPFVRRTSTATGERLQTKHTDTSHRILAV